MPYAMPTTQAKESDFTISLDCPCGQGFTASRLLPQILKGTGVNLDALAPDSSLFTLFTWAIPVSEYPAFQANRRIISKRIRALHYAGIISYGSW